DVSLAIGLGELVVVLGPSGSGKTTLLNVIGGIEPVTSGRLTVAGRDLVGLSADDLTTYRRETVGFVFQFFNLVPTLTALENVQLVAELEGSAPEQRSVQALGAVGLADRVDHFPGAMSGGQQQRVAIARAVVKEPPLLLADEPTGSLDLSMGRQVLALLRAAVDGGRTVLLVTHNAAIARMADRVVHIGSGQVVSDERNASPLPAQEVEW
ncbi:MAG TPA: ABC transporter ATP-binding protein, partial [Candidatus Limnocylindrales bacterium]|nr:ABC transporter ATP-binding protein [Candidatus Limnocylindrales bacterium]